MNPEDEKRLQEVRARLEKATQGEWIENGTLVLMTHEEADASTADCEDWVTFKTHNNDADRQLWIHAPEDLRRFDSLIAEQAEEIKRLEREKQGYFEQAASLRIERNALRSEANRAIPDSFCWLRDEVPEWWKTAEGTSVDVSTGTVYLSGIRLAGKGDYILRVNEKVWGCPRQVFEAVSGTNRAVEVVERKRDEWQAEQDTLDAQNDPVASYFQKMVFAANEILAELKGEG